MSGWGVEEWSGSQWIAANDVPYPMRDEYFEEYVSTAKFIKLHNASTLVLRPETKFDEPYGRIPVTWVKRDDKELFYRIKAYAWSGTGIRLTTHEGELMSGNFSRVRISSPIKYTGVESQKYNVEAEFVIFNVEEESP